MFLVTCKVKNTSDLMPYFMFSKLRIYLKNTSDLMPYFMFGKLKSYFSLLLINLFQEMFRYVAFTYS